MINWALPIGVVIGWVSSAALYLFFDQGAYYCYELYFEFPQEERSLDGRTYFSCVLDDISTEYNRR